MPTREVGNVEADNNRIIAAIGQNWRTCLASGNASFNTRGDYWKVADSRRVKRALKRAAKKAGAK